MPPIVLAFLMSLLRHVATAAGALLVSHGVATDGLAQEAAGAIITLGGLGLSYVDKRARGSAAPLDATGPVARTLGALALVVMLAGCSGMQPLVTPLVASIAPSTACALEIAAAVQAPGADHASDTAKAVQAGTMLLTDADCRQAVLSVAGAVQAAVAAATAPATPLADPVLTPPPLPALRSAPAPPGG